MNGRLTSLDTKRCADPWPQCDRSGSVSKFSSVSGWVKSTIPGLPALTTIPCPFRAEKTSARRKCSAVGTPATSAGMVSSAPGVGVLHDERRGLRRREMRLRTRVLALFDDASSRELGYEPVAAAAARVANRALARSRSRRQKPSSSGRATPPGPSGRWPRRRSDPACRWRRSPPGWRAAQCGRHGLHPHRRPAPSPTTLRCPREAEDLRRHQQRTARSREGAETHRRVIGNATETVTAPNRVPVEPTPGLRISSASSRLRYSVAPADCLERSPAASEKGRSTMSRHCVHCGAFGAAAYCASCDGPQPSFGEQQPEVDRV
jgi:hypothetical protein